MSVKRWNAACAMGLLLLTVLACKFSFTTANLSSLKLSKDEQASATTSSFGPKDTVYAVAEVSNSPGKMKLKGRLLFDKVEGKTAGSPVPGAETTIDLPGSAKGIFNFTPPGVGWPNGSYKVEVSLLDEGGEQKDQKTETFSVAGNTTAKTTTTETTTTQAPNNAAPGNNSAAGIFTLTGEGNTGTPLTLGPWQLTLDEKGTEVAGELDDGDGATVPVTGSRNGDQIKLTWGSGAAQFNLTGTLDRSGNLSGDFTQGAGARGKWQATKSS